MCVVFQSVQGRKGGQGFGLMKHQAGKVVSIYVGLAFWWKPVYPVRLDLILHPSDRTGHVFNT